MHVHQDKRRFDLLRELARERRAGGILALAGREDGISGVESLIMPGMRDASNLELAPLFVLFAQGFALLQSLSLGLTPDRPDPSGTVNRVVQGVTIHPWNGAGGHVPRR
jgi:tagatose-6-phosphate ketose/aldose isomerase